jgi:hypothetical protein
MRILNKIILLACVVVLLPSCESTRKAFSGDKSAPDEFAVFSRPPLTLPPQYKLRPPKPGVTIKRGDLTSAIAKRAMLNKESKIQSQKSTTNESPGMIALLRNTGGLNANSDTREMLNAETSILSNEDKRFVDKLIFWVDEGKAGNTIVNATKEQKRIQKTQALGKPITEGKTPDVKIERTRKGILDF